MILSHAKKAEEGAAEEDAVAAAAAAAAATAARELVMTRRLTAQLAPHLRDGAAGAEQVLMGRPVAWFEDLNGNITTGGVFLTTYAVVFLPDQQDPMSVALAAIHQIEKKKRTVIYRGYQREIGMLKIYCKDARVVRLWCAGEWGQGRGRRTAEGRGVLAAVSK